jgi:hypothetical protein
MRELVAHTAVIKRNAMVTIKRSMNGIILISLFVARFFAPPPPSTSTPDMAVLLNDFSAAFERGPPPS